LAPSVAPDGVTLTRQLADRLGVVPGDILTIEVMEGSDISVTYRWMLLLMSWLAWRSYMNTDTLNRLTGEGEVASAAAMYVDPGELSALSRRLKELPVIESVAMKAHTIDSFLWERLPASSWLLRGSWRHSQSSLQSVLVYNSARIGLQERAWELASLRILGFTRAEVARSVNSPPR
jgi:putative ABC transport system permease protein